MITFRYKTALPLFFVIAACRQAADPRICESPTLNVKIAIKAIPQVAATNRCIGKWATRLSRAQGATSQITQAVLTACGEQIEQTVVSSLPVGFQEEEPGVLTRQYEEAFAKIALFRVVQARAGNCELH